MMKLMAWAFRLLAALYRVVPVKNRVVFLSRQSSKMSLDYKLLIAYLKENYPQVPVEVCLSEPETKDKMAFITGTLSQLRYAATSRVCIVDGYVPAVCIPDKRPGCTVIQVWHALGAVKKFGYQSVGTVAGRSAQDADAARMHKNYDVVIAGGPGAAPVFAEAFGYAPEQVKALGLPRIDYLLGTDPEGLRAKAMQRIEEKNPGLFDGDKFTILYAPTLRKGPGYEGWLTKYVTDLASKCEGHDVRFIVAGHPLNNDFDASVMERFPFVHVVTGASTIDLLGLGDCVITDYSAVAFEAGLLGKAVYFYLPDDSEYRESPGLNIDPLMWFGDASSDDASQLMDAVLQRKGDGSFAEMNGKYFEGINGTCCKDLAALIVDAFENRD